MSKRYEFHSELSPEEIFVRLRTYAELGSASCSGDGTFRYQKHKTGFWLAYMGKWPVSGALPFWAEVKEEPGGSLISGGFLVWRSLWKPFAFMGGAAFLLGLLFGMPLSMVPLLAGAVALWLLLSAGLLSGTNQLFLKERRRAALDFIQQHLLE